MDNRVDFQQKACCKKYSPRAYWFAWCGVGTGNAAACWKMTQNSITGRPFCGRLPFTFYPIPQPESFTQPNPVACLLNPWPACRTSPTEPPSAILDEFACSAYLLRTLDIILPTEPSAGSNALDKFSTTRPNGKEIQAIQAGHAILLASEPIAFQCC